MAYGAIGTGRVVSNGKQWRLAILLGVATMYELNEIGVTLCTICLSKDTRYLHSLSMALGMSMNRAISHVGLLKLVTGRGSSHSHISPKVHVSRSLALN